MPDNPHTAAATGPPPAGVESCPGPEFLELHVAAASPSAEIEIHLTKCPACRDQVRRIRENNTFLDELMSANASEELPRQPFAESIPGYLILSDLSAGGQGVVYKAQQLKTRRMVALKVLRGGRFATPRQLRRFEREIELAASLRHPNIVTVFESGATADGRQYFAMELVEGTPLDKWLADDEAAGSGKSAGRRSESRVRRLLRLFTGICDGVSYAHQRGIIHRDLKPANILIDAAGEPRILDFGLAKSTESEPLASMPGLTLAGEFAGTFAYASPEQARGDADGVDVRTDVYSLGVILYEMLTRSLPYAAGGSITDALRAIADAVPRRPSTVCAEIDGEVETILLKALSKDPDRRYQSAVQFGRDVERYLAGEAIDAKRDSTWYVIRKTARRYRLAVILAGLALLLLATFSVAMVFVTRRVAFERDAARHERARADDNAFSLAAALHESNLERGRALGMVGNTVLAEQLLWSEYLTELGLAGATGYDRTISPARWALWELYERQPCLSCVEIPISQFGGKALSSDGRTFAASIRGSSSIELWDVVAGRCVARLGDSQHEESAICGLVFSSDGCLLASGHSDGAIRIWAVDKRRIIGMVRGHGGPVGTLSMCNDKSLLATGDNLGRIRLWSMPEPQLRHTLLGHARVVRGIEFTPDGRQLLSCCDGGSAQLWDTASGECINESIETSKFGTLVACFSPNGKSLAVANGDIGISIRSGPLWKQTGQIAIHAGGIRSMRFSPDGVILAAFSGDGKIRLWDFAEGRVVRTMSGHSGDGTAIAFDVHSGGSKRLLTFSAEDHTVRLWDLAAGAFQTTLAGHTESIVSTSFQPDNARLVSGSGDRTIRIWDSRDAPPRCLQVLQVDAVVNSVSYSADGLIASADANGTISLWTEGRQDRLRELHGHSGKINSVAFSPAARQDLILASTGEDATLRLWDSRTGACIKTLNDAGEPLSKVAFSPDGRFVAAGGRTQCRVHVWDSVTGATVADWAGHSGKVRAVCFSPDGRFLASCSEDHTIRLWRFDFDGSKSSATDGFCTAVFEGHWQPVFGISFRSDGRMLASCSSGGEIKLWNVSQCKCLVTLTGKRSDAMIFGVSLSADGRTLTSWGSDNLVTIWDLGYFDQHIAGNLEYRQQKSNSMVR